jgi:hypothetical protein
VSPAELPRASASLEVLTPLARLLLWDHGRGSLAYELLCLVVLALVLLTPAGFWGDPMVGWR